MSSDLNSDDPIHVALPRLLLYVAKIIVAASIGAWFFAWLIRYLCSLHVDFYP